MATTTTDPDVIYVFHGQDPVSVTGQPPRPRGFFWQKHGSSAWLDKLAGVTRATMFLLHSSCQVALQYQLGALGFVKTLPTTEGPVLRDVATRLIIILPSGPGVQGQKVTIGIITTGSKL
jgi:hypothetical protein